MNLPLNLAIRWPLYTPTFAANLSLPLLLLAGGTLAAAPFDQVRITSTPTQQADEFGYSVALSGKTLLAGAPLRDEPVTDSGAAFVFDRQMNGAWTQVMKLAPADVAANDNFGWAVAISDDTAIVGSKGDDDGASTSGSAYIFHRNHGGPQNWGQITKLHASDPAQFDQFGYAVAISASTAVVGAWPKDGGGGDRAGAVYVFERDLGGANAWGQATKLTASDSTGYELFGYSGAVSGDSILIGAPADDNLGNKIGAAYVFQRDAGAPGGWREAEKVLRSDSAPLNKFGAELQQVRNLWTNVAVFNLSLWVHTLVEGWAWNKPAAELCDRSDSPWDDPDRRPSHADCRNALRRQTLHNEYFSLSAVHCGVSKIRSFYAGLLKLAACPKSVFRKCRS